jgi:hypothetical protein
MLRVLAAAASFVLAFTAATPMAHAASLTAERPTQVNEATAAVGQKWQQVLPTGELVTMQKVSPGVSKTITPVAMATAQCPGSPYLCAWSSPYQDGTLWIYNMNNVHSNTANGVAHCWNMAADANNHTKSWYNMSTSWAAQMYNWVNCNRSGESFLIEDSEPGHTAKSLTCSQISPGNWCTTLFPTSIEAF